LFWKFLQLRVKRCVVILTLHIYYTKITPLCQELFFSRQSRFLLALASNLKYLICLVVWLISMSYEYKNLKADENKRLKVEKLESERLEKEQREIKIDPITILIF